MPTEFSALLADLAAAAPDARVEQEVFPSGAVWLDVMIGPRWFVLSAGPASGIGVSENTDANIGLTQHDRYFESLTDATAHLLALVHGASTRKSQQAA